MSEMIEVATADLSGEALGWAVGKAEGLELYLVEPHYGNGWRVFSRKMGDVMEYTKRYNPWEDWAIGGKLIESRKIELLYFGSGSARISEELACPWEAQHGLSSNYIDQYQGDATNGATPLEAACRDIVLKELGDTVDIPKELIQ